MSDFSKGVGERLKDIRVIKGLKQAEVADKIGMQRSSYSKVESGIYDLLPEYCVKLAELLGISCDYILRGIISFGKKEVNGTRIRCDENRFTKNLRPCLVDFPISGKRNAYFHCWSCRAEPVAESPVIGGPPGGQYSMPVAVVEYDDGQVDVVTAHYIKFTDRTEARET